MGRLIERIKRMIPDNLSQEELNKIHENLQFLIRNFSNPDQFDFVNKEYKYILIVLFYYENFITYSIDRMLRGSSLVSLDYYFLKNNSYRDFKDYTLIMDQYKIMKEELGLSRSRLEEDHY